MKKRILAGVLAAGMLCAALAGCGSSASTGTSSQNSETTASETSAPSNDQDADGGEVTLNWTVWNPSAEAYFQPLADAFMDEHPDIKINLIDLGSTDYSTILGTQLSGSGCDFDVVSLKDVPSYVTLINKGVLEPLDDLIAQDGVDLSAYNGFTDQLKMNDKLYQLPFRLDVWVLFYNKDVFDKAGIAYPTNDMTWDEYDKLARSLTVTTPGQEVYGTHYHIWRSATMMAGVLDGKHTAVDGDYEWAKPYYDRILSEQRDGVCQDYATLKTQGLHYSDAFAQGNIAMMPMGSWFISTLIKRVGDGEYTKCANWGMVKYPHAEGVEPGSTLVTHAGAAIPTSSKHKKEAWEFVKFISSVEGAQVCAKTGTVHAASDDAAMQTITSLDGYPQDDNSKHALETVNRYLELPARNNLSEIETVLNEQHDLIMTESESVDDGIKAMDEGVQAILNQ